VLVGVAGDWHGNLLWALKAVESMKAERGVDLVLQLGDFGIWSGPPGRKYLDRLNRRLEELEMTIWFLDGNHEDFRQLLAKPKDELGRGKVRPRILHLPRGHRWTWDHRVWLACGGAVSPDRKLRTQGKSWWPEEEITLEEELAIEAAGPTDVLLTHDCPSGVVHSFGPWPRVWDLQDLTRTDLHRERVQRIVDAVRPGLLLHGHLHRGYYRQVSMDHGLVSVVGLDCDGSAHNWVYLDTDTLAWEYV